MNKRTLFFLVNVPAWLLMSLIFFLYVRYLLESPLALFPGGLSIIILINLVLLISSIVSFYMFYSYLVPKFWSAGKKRLFILGSLITIFIISPLFQFALYYMLIPTSLSDAFGMDISLHNKSYLIACVVTIFMGGLGFLCRLILDSVVKKDSIKEAENTKLQSELNALKAKLNPHLLFNSINNIDSLILTKPELASTLLSKLSDLLRYVIYDTEEDQISIHKEISNLNKYIDLEKIRLVNPGSVSFSTKITKEVFIPPMLFFPFVENGFKHSNLNKEGQKLAISISVENSILSFESINTILENPKAEKKSGVGLMIVQKRLDLLYPGKYELTMKQENNEFHVTLQIKLD